MLCRKASRTKVRVGRWGGERAWWLEGFVPLHRAFCPHLQNNLAYSARASAKASSVVDERVCELGEREGERKGEAGRTCVCERVRGRERT